MSESRALSVMGMGSVLMNMIAGRTEGKAETVEVMWTSNGARVLLKGSNTQLMPRFTCFLGPLQALLLLRFMAELRG